MLVRYWSTRGARVRRTPPCLKCPTCASVILSSLHFVVVEKKKKKETKPGARRIFATLLPLFSCRFISWFILNRYKLRPILETSRLLRTNFKRTRHPFFNAYFRWTSIAKSFTNFESLIIIKRIVTRIDSFFFLYLVLSKLNRMYQNEIF